MKVRRNYEGNMLYTDAKELLELAMKERIVKEIVMNGKSYAVVYISGGKLPAGLYPIPKEQAIQDLMRNDGGILAIYTALKEKGIEFEPTLDITTFLFKDLIGEETYLDEKKGDNK